MTPKNASSVRWTKMPDEYLEKIRGEIKNFLPQLPPSAEIIAEGRIYPEEIIVRLGILEPGRLSQYNFEISKDLNLKDKIMDQINTCFDAAFSILNEFIQAGPEANIHSYPRIWKDLNFQKQKLHFQFSTVNSRLEAQANELLGIETQLFNENDENPEIPLELLQEEVSSMDLEDSGEKEKKPHLH